MMAIVLFRKPERNTVSRLALPLPGAPANDSESRPQGWASLRSLLSPEDLQIRTERGRRSPA